MNFALPPMPVSRYNQWTHRRMLVCADENRSTQAMSYAGRADLSPAEKDAYYLHDLVGSDGFEFVVRSNLQLNTSVVTDDGFVLVPCFLVGSDPPRDHPLFEPTMAMLRQGSYVYDGWMTITDWSVERVRAAVHRIDDAMSLLALRADVWFDWKPKYSCSDTDPGVTVFGPDEERDVERIAQAVNRLGREDRIAITRSLAWLSQGARLNHGPARYLFAILAIESLAVYIEDEAEGTSAFAAFARFSSKAERRTRQNACIERAIAELLPSNPSKAVEQAYFDCIRSIRAKVQRQLELGFNGDSANRILFDRAPGRKSLYDLRHSVAHGSLNVLSEYDRADLHRRCNTVEDIARSYIKNLLRRFAGLMHTGTAIPFAKWMAFNEGVVTREDMITGMENRMAFCYL